MSKKTRDLAKTEICKWEKADFSRDLDLLARIVRDPKYACRSCGRVARDKQNLCKAVKLPESPR